MSYDEWWAMPSKPKSEWVDGVVVVNSPATFPHGEAQWKLAALLATALPHLRVATELGVQLPRNRVRVPDVSVMERPPQGVLLTETPVLVVEILSPGTRSEDTVRKSAEYAWAGIGQYWIVDPALRSLEVLQLRGDIWESVLVLDDGVPSGSVTVAGHGTVALDLRELLG